MTIKELVKAIGKSDIEKIQICRPGSWDDFDEVTTSSPLLIPFGDAKVEELGAIAENVIRVTLDGNEVKYIKGVTDD